MKSTIAAVVGVVVILSGLVAQAAPIELTFEKPFFEDTYPLFIDYKYDKKAGTGLLWIGNSNASIDITFDGDKHQVYSGSFALTAVVDKYGVAREGSLSVKALFPLGANEMATLWNSNKLEKFGFTEDFKQFQFVFEQVGPSALGESVTGDGRDMSVLVRVDKLTGNAGWNHSFKSVGLGTRADEGPKNAPVANPLPNAALGGVALMMVALMRRVRSHSL